MSRELEQILESVDAARERGVEAVMATVVRVEGSTYRRPGARMLAARDGSSVGVISGGCLEREVVEKAWALTEGGAPAVMVYDATTDDELIWQFGMGCRGVVHLLLERVTPTAPPPWLAWLRRVLAGGDEAVLAVVLGATGAARGLVGRRLLVDGAGHVEGDALDGALHLQIVDAASTVLATRRSAGRCLRVAEGEVEVLCEFVSAARRLVVFGAGPDAIPVVEIGARMGWRVTLVDSRAAFATGERFAAADEIIVAGADEWAGRVAFDARSAAVVMTHRYHEDLAALRLLLSSPAAYIGMLGPRARTDALLAELAKEGVVPSEGDRARLFAPVGLDIGAETPEQIACAIAAEVQAAWAGCGGGLLRERTGPIHVPFETDGEARSASPGAVRGATCPAP